MALLFKDHHTELFLVVALISGISALAWLIMSGPLKIYRTASRRFAVANLLLIGVVISTLLSKTAMAYSIVSVVLLAATAIVYNLAVRRLFRINDNHKTIVLQVAFITLLLIVRFADVISVHALMACILIAPTLTLLFTALIKRYHISKNTQSLAGWTLTIPDFLTVLLFSAFAVLMLLPPDLAASVLRLSADTTLFIWLYIVLVLTLNATAFGASLSRIVIKMAYVASHDQLTGLKNRRAINRQLDRFWSEHQSIGRDFCILMLDLDHFKLINDSHGHHAGDEALKFAAETLKQELDTPDYIARFGGEEFIVLLPDVSIQRARRAANQLCQAFSQRQWQYQATPLTVSIGCASSTDADSLDQLLTQADMALYEAKSGGRAQARIYADAPPQSSVLS